MSLQFAGLQPRTVQAYKRAIRRFFDYLEDEDLPFPASHKDLDLRVSEFLLSGPNFLVELANT